MKRSISILLVFFLLLAVASALPASAEPSILWGDANRDGSVNKKDVLALKKYLANSAEGIDTTAADVCYDREINKKDLLRLKQYLAGWDVTLGISGPSYECIEPEDYKAFRPEEKVIAFTFDDGPGGGTERVLNVIDGTGDKVTFFIVGEMIDGNRTVREAQIKRALELGCEIGSHTYHHTYLYKSSTGSIAESTIREELDSLDDRFYGFTGEHLHIMRPPGGNFDTHKNYGYPSIIWSVDTEDWRSYGNHKTDLTSSNATTKTKAEEAVISEIEDKVLGHVRPGDIVLMHDLYYTSGMAFERIYPKLKAEGYKFVTASELLKIDPDKFDGWYFYATYSCGKDGVRDTAPRSGMEVALPPDKFYE